MVIFKTISWRNFLSTGNHPTTIFLNRLPSILITGHNGSGKSTLLDALCYGLYNKPFRNINKPQLVNTVNEKNMVIEIEFDVNEVPYKVIRGMKPGIFEIYRNDELLKHDAAIKDYQNKLEDILGLNYKAFTQIVVLGSARYQSFMDLSTNDRRVIIEELLDISVFSKMNGILKSRNNDNELEIKETDYQKEIIRTKISGHEGIIKSIQSRVSESSDKLEQEKARLELAITKIDNQIEEIESKIANAEITDDIKELNTKLTGAKSKARDIQKEIETSEKRIKFYEENDHCHTCTQAIDSEIKTSQITKLSSTIEERNKMKPVIADAFKTLENKIQTTQEKLDYVAKLEQDRRDLAHERKLTVKLKDEVKSNTEETDASALDEARKNLEEVKEELVLLTKYGNELIELKHYYDICKILLKDDGIKSKIIKQYLPIMNQLINQNLDRMGANYSFHLDEQFNEVIKSRYRDNFCYASFSEGEKMRIDLSLMFTWREIAKLKNSVNTNLLILDEIGDSSLDGEATDVLWEIINEMEGANVFVISHKTTNADKFDGHFEFKKEGNFSKIINSKK